MFDNFIIKTLSSDAESCEEQDGGKQFSVGPITAELQSIFQLVVTKKTEKKQKLKILTLLRQLFLQTSLIRTVRTRISWCE